MTNPPGTVVFIDVETTAAGPDRRAWEIGLYVRQPGEMSVTAFHSFIHLDSLDLGAADPRALAVGRFHERHPQAARQPGLPWDGDFPKLPDERDVMRSVEWLTRGAQLVGWNVAFDAATLDARMRWCDITPSFDYHLVEVSSLAAGYLIGSGRVPDEGFGGRTPLWSAGQITTALGLPPMADEVAHTALGDAARAMAIYDRVARGRGPDNAMHYWPSGGTPFLCNVNAGFRTSDETAVTCPDCKEMLAL